MVQELDQYSSLADLTTPDPMADWIEYNAKEMPYDFKDMVNASFEQAYYYGPFAKAYQYYRRTTDTEPTFTPDVLNKKFNTDAFKVPMSASLADDFIAMNNRRLELDAIVNQGTGSVWTDTAPWLAGQLGGGIIDPINLGSGVIGAAAAAPITGAISRLGVEALIGGTIPATAYQAFAPEQGEERSLSAFAQDVLLGAVIEMGAHGLAVGGKKALSAGYNKIKAKGPEAAAKVQTYAEKAFANGKKIDVDQVVDGDTPPKQPVSNGPSEKLPPVIEGGVPLKLAYAPVNAKGDVVSVGDSLPKERVAHADLQEAKAHGGDVKIYDYSNGRVASHEDVLPHFAKAYDGFKEKMVGKLKNSLAAKLSKADFSRLNALKYKLGLAERIEIMPPLLEDDAPKFWAHRKEVEYPHFDPSKHYVYHGGSAVRMDSPVSDMGALSGKHERVQKLYKSDRSWFRNSARLSDVGPALYTAIDFFHAVDFANKRGGGGVAAIKLRDDFKFYTMPASEKIREYYLPSFKETVAQMRNGDVKVNTIELIMDLESWLDELDKKMAPIYDGSKKYTEVADDAEDYYDSHTFAYRRVLDLASSIEDKLDYEVYNKGVSKRKADFIAKLESEGYEGLFNDRFLDYEPSLAIFDSVEKAVGGGEEIDVPPVLPDELSERIANVLYPDTVDDVLAKAGFDGDSIKYMRDLIGEEETNLQMGFSLLGTLQDESFNPNFLDALRQLAPDLYSDVLEDMKNSFDVLEYGDGKRVILNEENIPRYDAKPSMPLEEQVRLENRINHVDIDHSEAAFNEVPLIDEKFEAMKKVDSSLEEGEIQTLIGQLEANENMIPSVKKELEDLKKSGIMFKRLSKVYETFSNCIIGGGK